METVKINTKTAKVIIDSFINAASKDATRPHLQTVQLTKTSSEKNEKLEIAATDGTILSVIHLADDEFAEALEADCKYYFNEENIEFLKLGVKLSKKSESFDLPFKLKKDGDDGVKLIDYKRFSIQSKDPHYSVIFNAELLLKLRNCFDGLDSKSSRVKLTFSNDPLSPFQVEAESPGNGYMKSIMMPMRA